MSSEHISFRVERGQTLAIIGSTGSGKTTLAGLIPRFYDATQGDRPGRRRRRARYTFDALYDRLAYRDAEGRALLRHRAGQYFFFGQSEAADTDETLQQALQLSQAAEVHGPLPRKGRAPHRAAGRNVSGGQKQRLSIARALARRPEILIFDDSFSALDYKTDATLREGLAKQLPRHDEDNRRPAHQQHPPRGSDPRPRPRRDRRRSARMTR